MHEAIYITSCWMHLLLVDFVRSKLLNLDGERSCIVTFHVIIRLYA